MPVNLGMLMLHEITVVWYATPCTMVKSYDVSEKPVAAILTTDYCVVRCKALLSAIKAPTYRRTLLPPSSGKIIIFWCINALYSSMIVPKFCNILPPPSSPNFLHQILIHSFPSTQTKGERVRVRINWEFNPLKTKRRPLYLKAQFVPRSKHFSSRL